MSEEVKCNAQMLIVEAMLQLFLMMHPKMSEWIPDNKYGNCKMTYTGYLYIYIYIIQYSGGLEILTLIADVKFNTNKTHKALTILFYSQNHPT